MGENSKISWTDHTFNPWIGCTKVSDGCKHCYAESLMDKRYGKVQWGPQGTRVRTSAANWRNPLRWDRQAKAEGKRHKVFCASLADVFEDRPELVPWRADLFRLIDRTPSLDWLLLTKRPENIQRLWPFGWYDDQFSWPNVWIMTSVENQEQADERIPHVLRVPAVVRGLSCEPLLGPVWLGEMYDHTARSTGNIVLPFYHGINWVIAGAESGQGARPMDLGWVRSLRDQCQGAGVPFFFKQQIIGGKKVEMPEIDGKVWAEFPTTERGPSGA